jgi:hypothetical protein
MGVRFLQPDFRAPVFRELAFVAGNRAVLQVQVFSKPDSAVRQLGIGHVAGLPPVVR